MPTAGNRPSLKQLAQECGLSVAAVSMALRGHSRVSAATRARVTALAERRGYHTNPLLRSVMSHVRSGSGRRSWINIAFVWIEATPRTVRSDPFRAQTIASVSKRADQLGLRLEQFYLSEPGMTPGRLEKILLARGIAGIIFSPSSHIPNVSLPFDWTQFAVVVIGNTPWTPEFHRAAHHHYQGMRTALVEVERLGYRRPGAVLMQNLNERARRTPEAAFLTHHPLRDRASQLIFRITGPRATSDFRRWLARARPDCLLFPFFEGYTPDLGGIHLATKHPHAALDIFVAEGIAGMHQDFEAIGANAVDLLMTQLLHHDRGIPRRPKIVLAEGNWLSAPSLPPAQPSPQAGAKAAAAGKSQGRRAKRQSTANASG
jgi:DNA-binding LacI/PurR family transcriptional regulator